MDRPIGVFDSGVGGLTVMAEIMRLLPGEDIIYFGDTAHVPYGSKSKEVVTSFSLDIARFLLQKNVKMIVVACNTASAFALPTLKRRVDVPVLGVIEPGAKHALQASKSKRIGVIGTDGTIRSLSYTKAINGIDGNAKVFSYACPLFVPLVEEGWLTHQVTRLVAKEYLSPLMKSSIDTLVLGCTHYPLIKKVIADTIKPGITLIDSATATAAEVAETLTALQLVNTRKKKGSRHFFLSDVHDKFQAVGERFLGCAIDPLKKAVLDQKP